MRDPCVGRYRQYMGGRRASLSTGRMHAINALVVSISSISQAHTIEMIFRSTVHDRGVRIRNAEEEIRQVELYSIHEP